MKLGSIDCSVDILNPGYPKVIVRKVQRKFETGGRLQCR